MIYKFIFLLKKINRYVIAILINNSLLGISTAIADDNPFPSISVNGGDVVQVVGTHMETAMKYTTIAVGGILILICLGVIIHRLREDSREKDHGNLVMTFVLLALGVTLGLVLIGIGWTAFSTNIQS